MNEKLKQRVEMAQNNHMRCVDNNFFTQTQKDLAALVKELTEREAKLVEALKFYANASDYKTPYTGGNGKLFFDCGEKAKATLSELEVK